jgi:hypothetical protein
VPSLGEEISAKRLIGGSLFLRISGGLSVTVEDKERIDYIIDFLNRILEGRSRMQLGNRIRWCSIFLFGFSFWLVRQQCSPSSINLDFLAKMKGMRSGASELSILTNLSWDAQSNENAWIASGSESFGVTSRWKPRVQWIGSSNSETGISNHIRSIFYIGGSDRWLWGVCASIVTTGANQILCCRVVNDEDSPPFPWITDSLHTNSPISDIWQGEAVH